MSISRLPGPSSADRVADVGVSIPSPCRTSAAGTDCDLSFLSRHGSAFGRPGFAQPVERSFKRCTAAAASSARLTVVRIHYCIKMQYRHHDEAPLSNACVPARRY